MTGEGSNQLEFPSGEFMFRLRGEVLGPVPASEIYEYMLSGDIDESTRISAEEGDWRSLESLPDWRPFLYQAKAVIRARRARAEAEAAARKRRLRNIINMVIGSAALILLSFATTYVIVIQRPERDEENVLAWADKHVPLLYLPGAAAAVLPMGNGDDEAGDYGGISIDEILVEDAPELVGIKPTTSKRKKRKRKTVEKPPDKPGTDPKAKPDAGPGTTVASVGTLSRDEITSKVYARRNLNRLYSCLKSEIRRNEDLPGRVVVNFSIKNDGRIHNVQLDDVRLENGPLQKCFEAKLARLSFREYAGQVRNVTIPFDWKK